MNEYFELLHNPGHWLFEGTSDLVFAIPGYFFAKWQIRRHDRKHHNQENT